MKIIFDSEEEKNKFFNRISFGDCPTSLSSKYIDSDHCYCSDRDCAKCWEECGIEFEVKKQNQEFIQKTEEYKW